MLNPRQVKLLVLKSHNQYQAGDVAWVTMSEPLAHLIHGGYFRVLEDEAWQQSASTDSN
jgi:hypothetical protein